MILDMFNHLFPKSYFDKFINVPGPKDLGKRMVNIPSIVDLDVRFRIMDEFGDYAQIISLAAPPLEAMAGPDKTPDMARLANDGLAELVHKHPKRFPAFIASLPLNNPEESVKETTRAVKELKAAGIQLFTNVNGKPLDAEEFRPIFDEAARLDTTIWLHPARSAAFTDYATEKKSRFEIWWCFGWPYETTAAMSRIVFAGIFDRHPDLRIVTHHLGGMVPYFEGRAGLGWDQLGTRTSDEDYGALLRSMKMKPLEYFHKFYGDTALSGALPATRCGIEFFGADHVVFASDVPFDPTPGQFIRESIRVIENLGLSAADKEKICSGNAIRLCKLGASHLVGVAK